MRYLPAFLLVAFLLPANVFAAIAFDDASSEVDYTSVAIAVINQNIVSLTNQAGLLGCYQNNVATGYAYTSVNFGGASSTEIASAAFIPTGQSQKMRMWWTNSATSTGSANSWVIRFPANNIGYCAGAFYTGALQSVPTNATTGSTASTINNTTITGVATNSWVVSWNINNGGNPTSPNSNLTFRGTLGARNIGDSAGSATSTWGMAVSQAGASIVAQSLVELQVVASAGVADKGDACDGICW